MTVSIPVIAYGFEYDSLIYYNENTILCKSIENNLPVYCSVIIKETDINIINEKINYFENNEKDKLYKSIEKILQYRGGIAAKWRLVYYNEDVNQLGLDVGYEDEGDENGDPR